MDHSIYVYSIIVLVAFITWAYNAMLLNRGLAKAFLIFRQTKNIERFFEKRFKQYLMSVAWTLLQLNLIGYSLWQVLHALGLYGAECNLLGISLLALYFRDRFHYVTAIFCTERISH